MQDGVEEFGPRLHHAWHLGLSFLWLFIHDIDRSLVWLDDCRSQTELQLGLCSSVELLINSRLVAVKGDIGAGGIRESIELDIDLGRDSKKDS